MISAQTAPKRKKLVIRKTAAIKNIIKMALSASQLTNLIRRAPALGFRVCDPPQDVGAPECVVAYARDATPHLIRALERQGMKLKASHDGFAVVSGALHTWECKVCVGRAMLERCTGVGTRVDLRWRHHSR